MVVASGECRGEAMCIAAGRLNSMNGQPSTPQWAPMNLEALGCISTVSFCFHNRTQSTQTYRGLWRRQLLTGCLCGLCVLCISVRFAKALHLHILDQAPAKPTTPSGVGGSVFQTVNMDVCESCECQCLRSYMETRFFCPGSESWRFGGKPTESSQTQCTL